MTKEQVKVLERLIEEEKIADGVLDHLQNSGYIMTDNLTYEEFDLLARLDFTEIDEIRRMVIVK